MKKLKPIYKKNTDVTIGFPGIIRVSFHKLRVLSADITEDTIRSYALQNFSETNSITYLWRKYS